MSEDRRLDILAVVGSVIAVVVLVVGFRAASSFNRAIEGDEKPLAALLKRMPDSDVRADLAVLSDFDLPAEKARAVPELERAVKRFPNSARLNFRLGSLLKGEPRRTYLQKAADIDKENALPLYLLAAEEAEAGKDISAAINMLKEGNARRRSSAYSPSIQSMDVRGIWEAIELTFTHNTWFSLDSKPLRDAARSIREHARQLHEDGHTAEAKEVLRHLDRMGDKLLWSEPRNLMSVLIGSSVCSKSLEVWKGIAEDTNSQELLAEVAGRERRLQYTRAGNQFYTYQSLGEMMETVIGGMMGPVSAYKLFQCYALIALIYAPFLGWYAYRSRGVPPPEGHSEAASIAFSAGELLRLYILTFVPATIVGLCLVVYGASVMGRLEGHLITVGGIILLVGLIVALSSIWTVETFARRHYLRAFESVTGRRLRKWLKGVPAEDQREIFRRMLGVMGGGMCFLLVWLGLLSIAMRLGIGIYPWQYGRTALRLIEKEEQFTTQLLEGKAEVPEKYLREVQEMDKSKPESGSTSGTR